MHYDFEIAYKMAQIISRISWLFFSKWFQQSRIYIYIYILNSRQIYIYIYIIIGKIGRRSN